MFILIQPESKLGKERYGDMKVIASEKQWSRWTGGPGMVIEFLECKYKVTELKRLEFRRGKVVTHSRQRRQ